MWNEEKDAILMSNWGVISARKIGEMVGKSKSAVIGRQKRLSDIKHSFIPEDLRKYSSWKGNYFKPQSNYLNRPNEIYTSYGEPVKIKDLTGCVFPIDGTDLFCNAKCNSVYCRDHSKIAYQGKWDAELAYKKIKNI